MDPSIHGGVHIYVPDLATRSSCVDPWASAQTYYTKADFRNTKLRALVHSIYPHSSSPLCAKKTGLLTSALLGGFGVSTSGEHTPDPHGNTTVPCSCVFLGEVIKRVLHKISTCKLSYEAESSCKKASQLLSRKDGRPCGEEIMVLGT